MYNKINSLNGFDFIQKLDWQTVTTDSADGWKYTMKTNGALFVMIVLILMMLESCADKWVLGIGIFTSVSTFISL